MLRPTPARAREITAANSATSSVWQVNSDTEPTLPEALPQEPQPVILAEHNDKNDSETGAPNMPIDTVTMQATPHKDPVSDNDNAVSQSAGTLNSETLEKTSPDNAIEKGSDDKMFIQNLCEETKNWVAPDSASLIDNYKAHAENLNRLLRAKVPSQSLDQFFLAASEAKIPSAKLSTCAEIKAMFLKLDPETRTQLTSLAEQVKPLYQTFLRTRKDDLPVAQRNDTIEVSPDNSSSQSSAVEVFSSASRDAKGVFWMSMNPDGRKSTLAMAIENGIDDAGFIILLGLDAKMWDPSYHRRTLSNKQALARKLSYVLSKQTPSQSLRDFFLAASKDDIQPSRLVDWAKSTPTFQQANPEDMRQLILLAGELRPFYKIFLLSLKADPPVGQSNETNEVSRAQGGNSSITGQSAIDLNQSAHQTARPYADVVPAMQASQVELESAPRHQKPMNGANGKITKPVNGGKSIAPRRLIRVANNQVKMKYENELRVLKILDLTSKRNNVRYARDYFQHWESFDQKLRENNDSIFALLDRALSNGDETFQQLRNQKAFKSLVENIDHGRKSLTAEKLLMTLLLCYMVTNNKIGFDEATKIYVSDKAFSNPVGFSPCPVRHTRVLHSGFICYSPLVTNESRLVPFQLSRQITRCKLQVH